MKELLDIDGLYWNVHQRRKEYYKLEDTLGSVLFAMLAHDYIEMKLFGREYQDYLRNYIKLENGILFHDTLNSVMGIITPRSSSMTLSEVEGIIGSEWRWSIKEDYLYW